MTLGSHARVVFVSYAREDDTLRERLEVILKPLVRMGRLELWADHRIVPTRLWRDEIARNLERADLAVLLVSADFLASDYINEVELPRLADRGVPLVCVPVSPCGWHVVEPLEQVQWALPPERGLSAMTPDECDRALMSVFKTLEAVAVELDAVHAPAAARPPAGTQRRAGALTAAVPGKLCGVPALPRTYHARDADLEALKQQLLASADTGLVGRPATAGLQGQGGVGKSVLAAAACHDTDVRSWFPDGVYWVTLGESPDLVTRQRELGSAFGHELSVATPREGARELRRLVEDRRCLLVVDDVWSTAAAEAFVVTGRSGRVLYTTREPAVLADLGAAALLVDVMSPVSSLRFLERTVGRVRASDRLTVERAIALTGGSILALSLVAAAVRTGRGWNEVSGQLAALAKVFSDHPYADVFRSMRLAVDNLTEVEADRYRLLGVFPEDVAVPERTVAKLWGVDVAASTLTRLVEADLITYEDGRIGLQDLKRAFVVFDADQPWALAHRQLLDAHCPADGWSSLADDEPYLWDHLLYHLERAGEYRAMAKLVIDGRWLVRRIHRSGPHAAERDVARASEAAPGDPEVAAVLRMLRRWPRLFDRGLSLAATSATFISRLPAARSSAGDLAGDTWLQPARPLAEPSEALTRTLVGHESAVTAVAFSPDGTLIATAGDDGTVRLWSAYTHGHQRTLGGHAGPVTAVAFAPREPTLAATGSDGVTRLWNPFTGVLRRVLHGHAGPVTAVAFTSDGATLATTGDDGTVRLWEPATGKQRDVIEGDGAPLTALAFAPTGTSLATAGSDGAVLLVDSQAGSTRVLAVHDVWATAVAFSPDGRSIATTGSDGSVYVLGLPGGDPKQAFTGHAEWVNAVAFAPDGSSLATTGDDGTVWLWDAATGSPRQALTGHTGPVTGVAFAPDGASLATTGEDGTVRLWDPAGAARPPAESGHTDAVNAVAFAPDGATFATASEDATVRLWESSTGEERLTLLGHNGPVNSVAFAPREALLVTGSDDGSVRFWDPRTGKQRRALTGHTGWVTAVAIAPGGGTLATTSSDATIRVWDLVTGRMRGALTGHADWVTGLAFAPDGKILATTSSDGTARLWDIVTGHVRHTLRGGPFSAVAFARGGGAVVTTSGDGTVRLWDPRTGHPGQALAGHVGAVNALAIAPGGTIAATAGDDGTVRVWDLLAGDEVAAVRVGATVACVAFAPDGAGIAAGHESDVVCLSIRTRG